MRLKQMKKYYQNNELIQMVSIVIGIALCVFLWKTYRSIFLAYFLSIVFSVFGVRILTIIDDYFPSLKYTLSFAVALRFILHAFYGIHTVGEELIITPIYLDDVLPFAALISGVMIVGGSLFDMVYPYEERGKDKY